MKFFHKRTNRENSKPGSRRHRGLRVAVVFLIILILVLAGCWFAVPRYIESRIRTALGADLSQQLGVNTSVTHVDVNLPGRTVSIYGFRLQQPDGFGSGTMVYLPELRVRIDTDGLLSGNYRIEKLEMPGGQVNLKTLTNGESNVEALTALVEEQKKEPSEKPVKPWSLHVESLSMSDWAVNYHELTDNMEEIEFGIKDMNGELTDVRAGEPVADVTGKPAHLSVEGEIRSLPYSRGKCGIVGNFSPLTNGAPAYNMSVEVVGFELALIKPALPANTAALLGGDALDAWLKIRSDASFVEGRATIKMVAGYEYSLRIMGEVADPKISLKEEALLSVFNRSRGGIGALAGNIGGAGGSALKGATDVATGLAKGTAKSVGSFGSGLWETAKGIVTADGSEIGSGAKGMGAALTGGAKDAVFTAGGDIMEGAGEITGSLTGSKRAAEWRKEIPARWQERWKEARQWVMQQPFPPIIAATLEAAEEKQEDDARADDEDKNKMVEKNLK